MAAPAGRRQRVALNRGSSRKSSPRPCRSSARPRVPLPLSPWEVGSRTIGRQRVRRRPRPAVAPRRPLRPRYRRSVLAPLLTRCSWPSRPQAWRRRLRPPRCSRPTTTKHRNLCRPSPKRARSRCYKNSKPLGRPSTTTWSASCCVWKPRIALLLRSNAPSGVWELLLPTH